jgi:hypothetical protein
MGGDEDDSSTIFSVRRLAISLKWEIRTLLFVPIGILAYFFIPIAGYLLLGLTLVVTLLTGSAFSVIATVIFLGPILRVLNAGDRIVENHRSMRAGYRRLQQTKHMTLWGCFIAVSSSSMLYINLFLWLTIGGVFDRSPWLNPFVFGMNLNSILNDIGLLLVCGVFKKLPSPAEAQGRLRQAGSQIKNSVPLVRGLSLQQFAVLSRSPSSSPLVSPLGITARSHEGSVD